MIEVRFHGRGGQGAVTAARLLSHAAYISGRKDVQAFPLFGPERRGAPVEAYTRISNRRIHHRSQVYRPDYVVVLDSVLLELQDVNKGMKKGWILINSEKDPGEFDFGKSIKVGTVNATRIARERELKVRGVPIVNTPMLGATARIMEDVSMNAIAEAVRNQLGAKKAEKNIEAAEAAYDEVRMRSDE